MDFVSLATESIQSAAHSIAKSAFHVATVFGDTAQNLLFPPECTFCNCPLASPLADQLCSTCRESFLKDIERNICQKCGVALAPTVSRCPECLQRRFHFDATIPLGAYRDELRVASIRSKSFNEFALVRSLGTLMAQQVFPKIADYPADLVVPIPKYWIKRLFTGANSAELLSKELAMHGRLPCYPHALRWKRKIRKQSLLSVSQRQRNVQGALELTDGYDLKGTHVLLVDDTMTTGATTEAATRVLQKAGVVRVTVAVIARAFGQLTAEFDPSNHDGKAGRLTSTSRL